MEINGKENFKIKVNILIIIIIFVLGKKWKVWKGRKSEIVKEFEV